MSRIPYRRGLHEVGDGVWAWLQPDGGWGWSNAGLVADAGAGASLVVDTLFDLRLTAEMLVAMRRASPAAGQVDVLVNTHANGDHTYGNQLVGDARIVASARCAEEMRDVPPSVLAGMVRSASARGDRWAGFVDRSFGPFDFDGITLTLPTETFEGSLRLAVGDREVRLHEVGPAHTRGDVLVEVPDQRVVFTGDICFIGGHPIVWAGPIASWIAALDRILTMEIDTVVPGHGPVCGKDRVDDLRAYFVELVASATERFHAGLSPMQAARDIRLDRAAGWGEAERLVVNVAAVYRDLGGDVPADAINMLAQMAELAG